MKFGKKFLVATGLEAFFDTASNPALGSGNMSLGPQVFVGFPGILGGRSLFVPLRFAAREGGRNE